MKGILFFCFSVPFMINLEVRICISISIMNLLVQKTEQRNKNKKYEFLYYVLKKDSVSWRCLYKQ